MIFRYLIYFILMLSIKFYVIMSKIIKKVLFLYRPMKKNVVGRITVANDLLL